MLCPLAFFYLLFVGIPALAIIAVAARARPSESASAPVNGLNAWTRGAVLGLAVHMGLLVLPALVHGRLVETPAVFASLFGWPHFIHYAMVYVLWPLRDDATDDATPPPTDANAIVKRHRLGLAGGYAASWLSHPILTLGVVALLDAIRLPPMPH